MFWVLNDVSIDCRRAFCHVLNDAQEAPISDDQSVMAMNMVCSKYGEDAWKKVCETAQFAYTSDAFLLHNPSEIALAVLRVALQELWIRYNDLYYTFHHVAMNSRCWKASYQRTK